MGESCACAWAWSRGMRRGLRMHWRLADDSDPGGNADLGGLRGDRHARGFDGLAMMVQDVLKQNPYGGHLFVFRGKRADRIKVLWWDGTGLCLYAKRLERGKFVWPLTQEGATALTPAQLSMLCAGIDWR